MGFVDTMRSWAASLFGRRERQVYRIGPGELEPLEANYGTGALVARVGGVGYYPEHPLAGADVARIVGIMLDSEAGRLTQLHDLYDDMVERDPHLGSELQTRTQAISGRAWTVQAADESASAKEAARRIGLVQNELTRFHQVVQELADATGKGLGVQEMEWGEKFIPGLGRVLMPIKFHWAHGGRFAWNAQMQLQAYVDAYNVEAVDIDALGRARFIVHCPSTPHATWPTRRGAFRQCVWTTIAKRHGLKWWIKGIERYGVPGLYIQLMANNEHLIAQAKKFLRAIHTDFTGVQVGQMEVKEIPGAATFTGESHEKLCDYVDRLHSKAILGQTMATNDGGSHAQANVHDRVRQDLLQSDCLALGETIREDLYRPILEFNWPGLGPAPRAVADMRPRGREVQEWHYRLGILSSNETREAIGKPPREEDFRADPAKALEDPSPRALPSGDPAGNGDGRKAPGEDRKEYDRRLNQRDRPAA